MRHRRHRSTRRHHRRHSVARRENNRIKTQSISTILFTMLAAAISNKVIIK
jgi:hypothetical protein